MPARAISSRQSPPHSDYGIAADRYDDLLHSLRGLAEQMQSISQHAGAAYTPDVASIIRTRSGDVNHIEHTLDHLLDFCHSQPAVALFKQLCRYYWTIDPAATAQQVNAYREMWDSDEPQEAETAPALETEAQP